MAIEIPTFPNPFDPNTPLTNIYAWMSFIAFDVRLDVGRLVLNIHPNESAWESQPLEQISIALGELLQPGDPNAEPPVPPKTFPTMAELMQIPEFASAYLTIGGILYQKSLDHPKLAGSTISPPSETAPN
jgi:hypothetical protein